MEVGGRGGGEGEYLYLSLHCHPHLTHTRFQARSKDKKILKRREVKLDPQVSPEEIMSREVELGCENWTSFASSCSSTAVQRTLSL